MTRNSTAELRRASTQEPPQNVVAQLRTDRTLAGPVPGYDNHDGEAGRPLRGSSPRLSANAWGREKDPFKWEKWRRWFGVLSQGLWRLHR